MNKILILALGLMIVLLGSCSGKPEVPVFRIGYVASPHLAALFLAEKSPQWKSNFQLENFPSSSDVGYALASGKIDAGFVEPGKALAIKEIREFTDLQVLGKVKYKYGGVLVARKGLEVNLSKLSGLRIGRSEPDCEIFKRFVSDMNFNKSPVDGIQFEDLPFEDMIAALEAGSLDAVLTKSSYGIYAQQLGLSIPYSQYDIAAGDACCPAVVAELEFLLISRKDQLANATSLHEILLSASKEGDDSLRTAAAEKTGVDRKLLDSLPVASYELADDKLLQLFIQTKEDEKKENS